MAGVEIPRNVAKSVTVESECAELSPEVFAPNESVPRPIEEAFRGRSQIRVKRFLDGARNVSTVLFGFY